VPRPRLTERLNAGLRRKLTLVSAPAGFGKTTLLSSWSQHSKSRSRIAWLSLDEGDNDLTCFLTYCVSALQTVDATVGQRILAALQSPGVINTEAILTRLLNEVAEFPHDIVLILDDYHVIETQPVDQAVTYILEHLPSQMHLIVGSRSDPSWPLTRLRARGQMIEIRAKQLRFTLEEAASFLNQVMGLDLSAEDIASLEERTEGWITGLQLAALSMRRSDNVRKFISAFSGSDRYILDYLGQEVLAHQPHRVQMFLLQTSILNRLTGPLCDTLTGENNGHEMLVGLESGNMFIIPLDNERRWYRYHHLFGDLLKRRLRQAFPNQVAELHQRASCWYEQSGDINEAVHHALAAGDMEQTADILEDHWQVFFVRGELAKLKSMLDSLGPEITNNNVILRMAYCMIYSQTGAIELIPSHTAYVRPRIKDIVEDDVQHSSNLAAIPSLFEQIEAIVALANGRASAAKDHAKKAISLIPGDASPVDRRRLILAANLRLGQAHRELGEFDEASSVLITVLEMLKATESYYVVGTAIQILALYEALDRKRKAMTLCKETLDFVAKKHWDELPPVGHIHLALARLQADAGDHEAAQDSLDAGRRLLQGHMTPEIISLVNRVEEKLDSVTHPRQSLIEPLSPRELEILQLVAQGLSNREIAERLFLALSTVKGHNRNIFDKLQVHRRTEAVARARELGLL
jgi:LuxR family maltose regulon positive regulatory protein